MRDLPPRNGVGQSAPPGPRAGQDSQQQIALDIYTSSRKNRIVVRPRKCLPPARSRLNLPEMSLVKNQFSLPGAASQTHLVLTAIFVILVAQRALAEPLDIAVIGA